MDPENQYAANYASKAAKNPAGQEYRNLSSKMCWDAVKHCALMANIIDQDQYRRINAAVMIRPTDSILTGPHAISRLRPGQMLGFFIDGRMIHCMLALGQDRAAGNKNDCVGLGSPVGWEILNLGDLRWDDNQLMVPRGINYFVQATCHLKWISTLRFM